MARSRYARLLAMIPALLLPSLAGAQQEPTDEFSDFRPGADDYSIEMLRQTFGPIIDTALGGADADGGSALAAMMAVYLSGVVAVGMAFFFYLTVRSIFDTAQDGQFLGKQLGKAYMPIRLGVGVALLLPVASGFCLLQLIIFWVAGHGVGLANLAGARALDAMTERGSLTMPDIPSARGLAANILLAEVCLAAFNAEKQATNEPGRIERVEARPNSNSLIISWNAVNTNFITPEAACGSLTFSRNSNYSRLDDMNLTAGTGLSIVLGGQVRDALNNAALTREFEAAHHRAVQGMIRELSVAAAQIVRGERPAQDPLTASAQRYELYIQQAARSALATARSMSLEQAQRFDEDVLKQQGWIYWGAYYNHITGQQDAMQKAANMTPSFVGSAITTQEIYLTRYEDALIAAREYIRSAERSSSLDMDGDSAGAPQCEFSARAVFSAEGSTRMIEGCISRATFAATREMAEVIGGDNTSHVAQTRELGHVLINTGYAMMVVQLILQMGATNAAVATVGGLGISNMITPMFSGLLAYLFGAGAYLAYYLPMVPFLIWLPAVLKWLIAAFEAVIAAPLWAAAHIHPDGDDRVGMAGPGYMMLLSLFLRPVLMVFGMVGAILLAHPAAGFINATFMIAVGGAMSGDSITGVLGFLAYVLIYCIAMTTMLHGIFSLVHYIPDNVPRWIGHAIGVHGASDIGDEGRGSSTFYGAMSTVQANTGAPADRTRKGKGGGPPGPGAGGPGGGSEEGGGSGGGGSGGGSQKSEDQRQREVQHPN